MFSKSSLQPNIQDEDGVILTPMYRLPLFIMSMGFPLLLLPIRPWPTLVISGFGLFLLLQSFTLRLKFTSKELIVLQLGRELRRFPFKKWIAWRILLPKLPGLLYFREEASPHLLPILFNTKMLEEQLKIHVGKLQILNENNQKVPS
ncbi:DUF3119 family protein [Prochlorococcus marinus]|uniref:Glycerol dehydrogenase n=1 Tax=Prochlorococcus marinus (strain MIT 9211) TaxID=93059 RepID=A9BBU8_PROM4|nr:DUF3119 family protein [Prochlorococcus marinus]ABX09310.1 conserved hypothetical protein [Prochlorococcus marinus str. MIT 9211]